MTERPSPHSIAICALITLQHDREDENRALCSLIERLLTSPSAPGLDPCIHPPFSTLLKSIGTNNNNKISQTLTERLKSLCMSVDALVDFFEYLSSTFNTTNARNKAAKLVDGTSIQGIYIRQQTLGYQTLSFESVTRLWDALCRYVGGSSSTDTTDNNNMELWPPSVSQMESYLQNKCLSLEYDDGTPHCNTDQIVKLLQSYYPQVPSLHYYQYLHSIQRNERMASYEAFYRYFDYSMIQERRRMAATSAAEGATSGTTTTTTTATAGTSSILQYAPIELAALHAEFGYIDSSRMANQEAIRVAQQYHDGACVAYAMAWIPQQRHNTLADSKDFLRQCQQRASSNRLYHLASGVALSLAQQEAHNTNYYNGGELLVVADEAPRKIWNALSSADTRTTDSSTTTTTTTIATVLQENSSCMDTLSILAQQTLVSSAVWEIFGNSAMSCLLSEISLDVYGNVLSGIEYVLAKHKNVMSGFVGHRSALLASSDPGTATITMSPKKAATISSPSSDGSVHAKALWNILSLRKSRYPETTPYGTSVHTIICFTTALLLHDLAVSQGKRYDIQPLKVFLNSVADGGSNVYGGIVPILQVAMQSASMLCLWHRQEEARSILQRTIRIASQHRLSNVEGRVLYQLCELTFASDSLHPARVLPLVLECLSLAQRLSYDSLHASAIGLLARVFLSMGYWRRSIPLIRGSLPFVLAHAPLEVQGVLWLTLAKSVLLQAGDIQPPHPPLATLGDRPARKVVKLLNTALLQINESIVLFQKIQSTRMLKESFYLKARLCNDLYHLKRSDVASEIDYLKERNTASNSFRSICRQEVKESCLPVRSYNLRRCLNDIVEMEQLIATVL